MMVIVQSGFWAKVVLSSLRVLFLEEKWYISNIISARSLKITAQSSSENRFSDLEDHFCPLISKVEKKKSHKPWN